MTDVIDMNGPFTCAVCKIVFDNDCPVCLKCNKPVCPNCSLNKETDKSPDYCPLCETETGWKCKDGKDYNTD